jgi:tRNA (cmo5U34)-methyltransferase
MAHIAGLGALDVGDTTTMRSRANAAAIANHPTDESASRTHTGRLLTSCQTASMVNRPDGDQFHFDPATYLETIREEVPAYDELQDAVAEATADIHAERVLELGVGTGQTSRRVLDLHPEAELVGIDESAEMLAAASADLAAADLRVSRLQDPHCPRATSTSSCRRSPCTTSTVQVRPSSSRASPTGSGPGGRFVLGDVVVPEDPADVITPIDDVYDKPSTIDDQLRWLAGAGLDAEVVWANHQLAVIVADSPS